MKDRSLMARLAEKYKGFAATGSLSLEDEERDVATVLRCAAEAYTESRFRALERRIKKLEQFHCEHEFSDTKKGCLESIFCSKCGALHPDWERCGGGMALPYPDDAVWIGDSFYAPKRKEAP